MMNILCTNIKNIRIDDETDENRELFVGRHGCQQELADYANYGVLCSDHTDECFDIALDSLPDGHNYTIYRSRVCICSGEL